MPLDNIVKRIEVYKPRRCEQIGYYTILLSKIITDLTANMHDIRHL